MTIFEDFVKTELPVRSVVQTDEAEETLLVRRGIIPRAYVGVTLTEGQVLGLSGGVLQGVSGGGTANNDLTLTAGEDLGGNRAVKPTSSGVMYASVADDLATDAYCIGITTSSVLNTEDVAIRLRGEMEEGSWTWNVGLPIFFNSTGVLTQTPSATGYNQEVGVALTSTKILIEIKQPILR